MVTKHHHLDITLIHLDTSLVLIIHVPRLVPAIICGSHAENLLVQHPLPDKRITETETCWLKQCIRFDQTFCLDGLGHAGESGKQNNRL